MLQAYASVMPEYSDPCQKFQLLTDALYRIPQLNIAELERAAPTFVYQFNYQTPHFGNCI